MLCGTALTWTTGFKMVPELQGSSAYIARVNTRPAVARVAARDSALAAEHEAAATAA